MCPNLATTLMIIIKIEINIFEKEKKRKKKEEEKLQSQIEQVTVNTYILGITMFETLIEQKINSNIFKLINEEGKEKKLPLHRTIKARLI